MDFSLIPSSSPCRYLSNELGLRSGNKDKYLLVWCLSSGEDCFDRTLYEFLDFSIIMLKNQCLFAGFSIIMPKKAL